MIKINKIEVKGLFGAFNHPIPLKSDAGVTLILAENGYGKTVILQMVKAFFEKNFIEIKSQIFTEFILSFSDSSKISIKRVLEKDKPIALEIKRIQKGKTNKAEHKKITFSDKKKSSYYRERLHEYGHDYHDFDFNIRKYLPISIERIGGNRWFDRGTGVVYSTGELVRKYGIYLPEEILKSFEDDTLPVWLTKYTDCLKVKIIETQRLLTRIEDKDSAYRSSVVNYSKELTETIKNKRSAATDLASQLDRTYPNRIITRITHKTKATEIEQLQNDLNALETKRNLLNSVGLIDTEEENFRSIASTIEGQTPQQQDILKEVLAIYIEDSNDKLNIYTDIARKIELLLSIINKRFRYKKLKIDKTKGFIITSSINGKEIPVSNLSSGEQHELVLFYQLLFCTEQDSLLLIDEPEISLHISWQKQFLIDITEVVKLSNLIVIMATHSPDIIGNRWDLTVELEGAVTKK